MSAIFVAKKVRYPDWFGLGPIAHLRTGMADPLSTHGPWRTIRGIKGCCWRRGSGYWKGQKYTFSTHIKLEYALGLLCFCSSLHRSGERGSRGETRVVWRAGISLSNSSAIKLLSSLLPRAVQFHSFATSSNFLAVSQFALLNLNFKPFKRGRD